jgi:hypothetical protein
VHLKHSQGQGVSTDELKKVENYLRRVFSNEAIRVRSLRRKDETAEVFVGEEPVGVLHRDDEEGELSYHFTMTILDLDFEG